MYELIKSSLAKNPLMFCKFAFLIIDQARGNIISKINRTMEIHRRKSSPEIGNGVLGRLLEEESLPDDAVADFIINLLFAGNETTSKTMLFAVYFLTQCPKAMKQLLVHFIDQHSLAFNSSTSKVLITNSHEI